MGSRCINDQGFRFYGLDCTDCRCVPEAEEGSSAPSNGKAKKSFPSQKVVSQALEPQDLGINEDTETLMEKLDFVMDNLGNYLIAAIVVTGLLVLGIFVFLSSSGPGHSTTSEEKRAAVKKAES